MEAKRIGELEIAGDVRISSRIEEIWTLGGAMNTARAALRNVAPYIPKTLVENLIAEGAAAEIGGTRRQVAVLFSDIQDFSAICEVTEAEEIIHRISEYFDSFQEEVHDAEGVIDKYIGDSVMAIWNAPKRVEDFERCACRAALHAIRRSEALAEKAKANGVAPFVTRIGLNAGEALVGNVGSVSRMNYTAYGTTVVIASRLEALNKYYHTRILAAEALVLRAEAHFVFRPIDIVMTKGSHHATWIYELIGARDPRDGPAVTPDDLDYVAGWEHAYELMQARKFKDAMAAFAALSERRPEDETAVIMRRRAQDFMAAPPGEDWDGVTRFETQF